MCFAVICVSVCIAIIIAVISVSSPHPNDHRTFKQNMIWAIIMCSYASTCFVIGSSCLCMYIALYCAQHLIYVHVFRSVWIHSFVVVVAAEIVCIFPFPLIEIISFIVITVHIVQQISPPVHSIPFQKIESVSEVTHTFYHSNDGIESHLFVLWHLMKSLNWLELHNCVCRPKRKIPKSEISECHAICIEIMKLFNAHTLKCVGSCMQ